MSKKYKKNLTNHFYEAFFFLNKFTKLFSQMGGAHEKII